MTLLDVVDHRVELLALGLVDDVGEVVAHHRAVRRDDEHVEVVDVRELGGLGVGRTGHAAELVVHPEVVLEGDRREGLVLALDRDAFLRLDRLVQAVGPASPRHQPAGELVDDDHLGAAVLLVALDDVLDVLLLEGVGDQRLLHRVQHRQHRRVVEVVDLQQALDRVDALVGQRRLVVFLVDPVVATLLDAVARVRFVAGLEARDDLVRDAVEPRVVLGRAGDDQRGPRLVDQDRVDLVDDREVQLALDEVLDPRLHVVAQVVEAELVVRPVGDVRLVGRLAGRLGHVVADAADREPEEAVDLVHPLGVALREVVVDGHDVDAAAGERVQVRRQRRDEGLALARLHLGDLALVEDHAADQLDVEVTLADRALHRLAHGREGLGDQVVERLAVLDALLEVAGARAQRGVGQLDELGLEAIRLLDERDEALQLTVVLRADDPLEDVEHRSAVSPTKRPRLVTVPRASSGPGGGSGM